MTFTPEAPTEPGFYAWKPAADSQPRAVEVYKGKDCLMVVGPQVHDGIDDDAVRGGLWCRLVPVESHPLGDRRPSWKRSMLQVESAWDPQAVAESLGLSLGSDIRAQILPAVETLQRELAEAKAHLEGTERARAFAMENSTKAIEETLVLSSDLKDVKKERDTARAEAAKWRECAEKFYEACTLQHGGRPRHAIRSEALKMFAALCPSPPQSSPSPEPCKECGGTGGVDTGAMTPWGTFYEATCPVCQPPTSSSQSLQDSAIAQKFAPAEATASRLQALESGQDILRRRTDMLLGHVSALRRLEERILMKPSGSFQIEWPPSMALPTLTSTSPPTSKPGSSDGKS